MDEVEAGNRELPVGTRLARFEIERRLGSGGMGVVYAARDVILERRVALKLLHVEGSDAAGRLIQEAQTLARLVHPNVVTLHDVGIEGERVFLAMELVEGGTVRDWLRAAPRSWREIVDFFLDAGEGLAAAHERGIVHRDVKPDNILAGSDGRPRIGDFGLARAGAGDGAAAGSGASATALRGTPAYMAPEQHLGRSPDHRADQWSFCVSLYEALHGEPPFAAPDGPSPTLAAAFAAVEGKLRPPPVGRRVPPRIRAVLRRGMSTDPEGRFPSTRALLSALRSARRSRATWIALGVLLAAAAAASIAVLRPPAPLRPRRLTQGEETLASAPVFSADGQSLIFASDRGGRRELWTLDLESMRERQLTDDGPIERPHLAGDRLCWQKQRGELAELTCEPAEVVRAGVAFAEISAKGELMVADARFSGFGGPRTIRIESRAGAPLAILDGGDRELRWARWSPDGRRVGFALRPPGDNEPCSLGWSDRGSELRPITVASGLPCDAGFAWSRDSSAILAFRGAAPDRRLVLVDLDGDEREIAAAPHGKLPSAGADGRFAYVEDVAMHGLWLREAGHLRRVTYVEGEVALGPQWLPARGELAYVAARADRFEIRRVNGADWSEVRARRAIEPPTSAVSYSDDGRLAVLGAHAAERAELRVVEVDGEAPPRVLLARPRPAFFVTARFAPGGRRVVFVVKEGPQAPESIWDIALEEGARPRLLLSGAFNGLISPDGRRIVFGRPGSATMMWWQALDEEGLPSGPIAAVPGELPIRTLSFDPGGALLASDADGLVAIDLDRAERRPVLEWPPGTWDIDRFSADPAGRLAISMAVSRTSLVVLEP